MNPAIGLCEERLRPLLRHELAAWEGLPGGCAEPELATWLALRAGEGIARLGSDLVEYVFRVAEPAGFAEPVRLYFHRRELCLVRTGLWSSDPTESAKLLRDLGDPPGQLDLVFDTSLIAGGEWVYAERGLTLAVIPDTGVVAGVNAYRPCSVSDYRRRFYDGVPTRELPGGSRARS